MIAIAPRREPCCILPSPLQNQLVSRENQLADRREFYNASATSFLCSAICLLTLRRLLHTPGLKPEPNHNESVKATRIGGCQNWGLEDCFVADNHDICMKTGLTVWKFLKYIESLNIIATRIDTVGEGPSGHWPRRCRKDIWIHDGSALCSDETTAHDLLSFWIIGRFVIQTKN